ncbi:MAG: hypothetical protein PHR35_14510, partial [Kiritimatiellae bacterium]|nr:hypothetical protein [Kiritimatiellia bacterium]
MRRLILKIIAIVSVSAGLKAEEIDLFILAGQSNAQGWMGNAAEYPADPQGLDGKIRLCWTSPG